MILPQEGAGVFGHRHAGGGRQGAFMCIEFISLTLQSVFHVFFQVVEQIKNSRGEMEARRHLVNVVTARDLVR